MCLRATQKKPQLPEAAPNYISEVGLKTICFHYLSLKVGSGRVWGIDFNIQHKLFLAVTLVTYYLSEFRLFYTKGESEQSLRDCGLPFAANKNQFMGGLWI